MTTAFMCTVPDRLASLRIAVASILPQIDRLIITLNNWPEGAAPDFGQKVELRWADNSFRFGTKHVHLNEAKPGIGLFVDDDIEYPKDYVSEMVHGLERHALAVVSLGGRVFMPTPIESYWKDTYADYRVFSDVRHDVEVDYPNGATMAFRIPEYGFGPGNPIWEESRYAEAGIGAYCRSVGMRCIVMKHSGDWLRNLMPLLPPKTETMFDLHRDEDGKMRDFVNKYF